MQLQSFHNEDTNNKKTVQLPCLNGTDFRILGSITRLKVEGVMIKYSERAIPQWENNLGRRGGESDGHACSCA